MVLQSFKEARPVVSGQCAEELCVVFPGQRKALESEAKPHLDWAFPAVPAKSGQGVLGGGPLKGSLWLLQELAPYSTTLWLPLPDFRPVIELSSSRVSDEDEGPQGIHLPCTD